MKKIKGLKINIHKRDVMKYLRTQFPDSTLDADTAALIEKSIPLFTPYMSPAVVYETYSRRSMPQSLGEMLSQTVSIPNVDGSSSASVTVERGVQLSLWNDCLAVTLCAVTIGLRDIPENICRDNIGEALASSAVDSVAQFVYGLVGNEASGEDCELGPCRYIENKQIIDKLVSTFGLHTINISAFEQSHISKSYNRFMMLNWIPKR